MFASATKQNISIKEIAFELMHIKLKASAAKQHSIAWCAAGRLVQEETISGKIPGLYGRLHDGSGDFVYECYVTSPFLDQHVRPERFGFDIAEISEDLFSQGDLSLKDIRDAIATSVTEHLKDHLEDNKKAGRERVEHFASHKAPRYRPILARVAADKLDVDPSITDKELDILLHKQLMEIEGNLVAEGHEVMNFGMHETPDRYRARLADYLEKVDDLKKSDLAMSSYPITSSSEQKEPDICALNVYDEPILVAEGDRLPLASIIVIEIKRPMRNDARAGEDKDPVEQALGYLDRIRKGQAQTSAGRPIPRSEQIPGFCYAICDITPSVENRCKLLGLKATHDG